MNEENKSKRAVQKKMHMPKSGFDPEASRCPRIKPSNINYESDALPTELPRQEDI